MGRISRAVRDSQRTRLLSAIATEANEHGVRAVTVASVVARAGVSRRTFYEIFTDSGDCLLTAIEQATAHAAERAKAAIDTQSSWACRVREGLSALLEFFDEDPTLARVCAIQSLSAGPAALAWRSEILGQLAEIVDAGRASARQQPPPVTAEGVVGGVLNVISSRLSAPQPNGFAELLGPLMSFIVLPYLGAQAARRELHRSLPSATAKPSARVADQMNGLGMRLTSRTVRVLAAVSAQPGLTSAQIAQRAEIAHQSQISTLLTRLASLGLVATSRGATHRRRPARVAADAKRRGCRAND